MASIEELEGAVKAGNVAVVKEAIRAGSVKTQTAKGESLILAALFRGHTEMVSVLAEKADLNLFEAAALGKSDRIDQILTVDPKQVNDHSSEGFTALHFAAFLAHHAVAESLLKRGAKVGALSKNAEVNTPLHAAIAGKCDKKMVEFLVSHGADVNLSAARGVTPLHLAASRGNRQIVDYLIERKAVINAKMNDGQSAAAIADARGHSDLAKYLNAVKAIS